METMGHKSWAWDLVATVRADSQLCDISVKLAPDPTPRACNTNGANTFKVEFIPQETQSPQEVFLHGTQDLHAQPENLKASYIGLTKSSLGGRIGLPP